MNLLGFFTCISHQREALICRISIVLCDRRLNLLVHFCFSSYAVVNLRNLRVHWYHPFLVYTLPCFFPRFNMEFCTNCTGFPLCKTQKLIVLHNFYWQCTPDSVTIILLGGFAAALFVCKNKTPQWAPYYYGAGMGTRTPTPKAWEPKGDVTSVKVESIALLIGTV